MPDASKHDPQSQRPVTALNRQRAWRVLKQRRVWLGLLLAVLCADYVFIATAGKFSTLEWRTHTYDLAADGFRQGHLYLPIQPSPKLLDKVDPYDRKHEPLWLWDASLYGSHYFIYWGPVPALCLLALKLFTGYSQVVDDQWLVLFFMLGRLFGGTALLWTIAPRLGRQVPTWAVVLAMLMFALASPTPYFLVRPLIYEASIAAGQCFLVWGLVAALWGLIRRDLQLRLFVLASVAWGLALSSRGSLCLVAPLLVLITWCSALRRPDYGLRPALSSMFALGVPIALILLAHGWYNYARFESVLEFGLKYQLTGRQVTQETRFILPNLFSYFGGGLRWDCWFPYVDIAIDRKLSPLIEWPDDYQEGNFKNGEHAAGMLVATTFVWFIGFWVVRLLRRAARTTQPWEPDRDRFLHLEQWLLLCAAALCVTMLPALLMYMATMRYMQDFTSGWLLAAILGGFWLIGRTTPSRSRVVTWLASMLYVAFALHTLVVGALLGFRGQSNNFRRENSALFWRLQDKLSVCRLR